VLTAGEAGVLTPRRRQRPCLWKATTRDKAEGLKVLVVEDYEDTRFLMRVKLEQMVYQVVEALTARRP